MNFNDTYSTLLETIPQQLPALPTFMEIAGYPHYENVCSTILKYYLEPDNPHGLGDLLLRSFLRSIKREDWLTSSTGKIRVHREFSTDEGRIDLVIESNERVIAIENKIRHQLNNDLAEYADFLDNYYPHKDIQKIVLSIRPEHKLERGFVNLLYEHLVREVDRALATQVLDPTNEHVVYFLQFIRTLRNLSTPIQMTPEEIEFLVTNHVQINALIELSDKMNNYIAQRAWRIVNRLPVYGNYKKDVWEGYDMYFLLQEGALNYKLECPITQEGVCITICDYQNRTNRKELQKLAYFQANSLNDFQNERDGRLLIEDNIPFNIDDDELVEKLDAILQQFKVVETP